jgi:hypothetical protein
MIKELTIEHWAAYLPYGIKAKISRIGHFNLDAEFPFPYSNEIGTVKAIWVQDNKVGGVLTMGNGRSFDFDELEEITVCVRPLSQLTEVIEHNGERFVPIDWFEIGDDQNESFEYDYGNIKLIKTLEVIAKHETWQDCDFLPNGVVRYLHSLHFDTFGLIDSGLAEPIPSIEQP